MRHAEHDLGDAQRAAHLDDRFHRRDHRLAAIKAEALGADIFAAQEALILLGFHQLVEDGALAVGGEVDFLVASLELLLQEAALLHIIDVHILEADVPAVVALQDAHQLADGGRLEAKRPADMHRPVEILLAKAMPARRQVRRQVACRQPQRIEIGGQMPAHPVGADQHHRIDRILRGAGDLGGAGPRRSGRSRSATANLCRAVGKHAGGIEAAREIVTRQDRPVRPGPTRPGPILRAGQQGFDVHRTRPWVSDSCPV